MKIICTLLLSTLVTGQFALAAGAANWDCVSNKSGLTATYETSMFGETLTIVQSQKKGSTINTTYFVDETAQPAPGSKMMLQDDPNQDDLQKKEGTYSSELAEVLLSKKSKYDMGFQFQGSNFSCVRN